MGFCNFNDRFGAFAVTPVENLFIDEFMLRAPGDYVRVYLYGLRMCWQPEMGASISTMSRALGMDEQAVLDAFTYWERQGVLRRVADSPLRVEYLHLMDALLTTRKQENDVYHYQDFNQSLQQLFGDKLLHPADYQQAYDWIEVLGIRPEAILLMVQHTFSQKKGRVTMNYLDKVARTWAEKGIVTLPAAREFLEEAAPTRDAVAHVLRAIGLKRAPTAEEARLYDRWTSELNYDHAAIMAALPRLASVQKPNFAYIDKMLTSLYNEGVRTAAEMPENRAAREEQNRLVRAVSQALGGASSMPTDAQRGQCQTWLSWGFSADALALVARRVNESGGRLFSDVEKALTDLKERGITGVEAIAQEAQQEARLSAEMAELLSEMGVTRAVTAADRRVYCEWLAQGYSRDLMIHAARRAQGARIPIQYAQKMLLLWREEGITTPEQAQKQQPAAAAKPVSGRPGKEVAEHRYGQRTYTDEEFNAVFDNPLSEEE